MTDTLGSGLWPVVFTGGKGAYLESMSPNNTRFLRNSTSSWMMLAIVHDMAANSLGFLVF